MPPRPHANLPREMRCGGKLLVLYKKKKDPAMLRAGCWRASRNCDQRSGECREKLGAYEDKLQDTREREGEMKDLVMIRYEASSRHELFIQQE